MSTLETNSIGKYNGNNVSVDDALRLKSYSESDRDALTSVAGDTIYNSDTNKPQYYDGSAWNDMAGPAVVKVDYVVIGGGGSGGSSSGSGASGGGGAGGYLSHYASENSGGGDTNSADFYVPVSTNLTVTIGAGAPAQDSGRYPGFRGTGSHFANISPAGGGGGGTWGGLIGNKNYYLYNAQEGASGGGQASICYDTSGKASGKLYQGYAGGAGTSNTFDGGGSGSYSTRAGGGGGGAGAVGADGASGNGGNGGAGVSSSITGSAVERAGGGGGGANTLGTATGGGGNGNNNGNGVAGTANTGGGGGGSHYNSGERAGGAGGSGVVILRYPNTFTLSQSGLTTSHINTAVGDDKYTRITGGTGTVSFA
jgi:hypothetical protein